MFGSANIETKCLQTETAKQFYLERICVNKI